MDEMKSLKRTKNLAKPKSQAAKIDAHVAASRAWAIYYRNRPERAFGEKRAAAAFRLQMQAGTRNARTGPGRRTVHTLMANITPFSPADHRSGTNPRKLALQATRAAALREAAE